MKTTMEKDTILFIDKDGKGLGMNYGWYTKNYHKVVNNYGSPEKIFYKAGDTVNTWIDFRRAIQIKQGSFMGRIQAAVDDPLFHISDIREIPATDYYDAEGFMHRISAYDGQYNAAHWVQRIDDPELKYEYDYSVSQDGNHLIVIFKKEVDLNNSIISLNGLFYPYEIIAVNTIRFVNVVDQLAVTNVNMTNLSDDEIFTKIKELKVEIEELNDLIEAERNRLKVLNDTKAQKEALLTNPDLTDSERNSITQQIAVLETEITNTSKLIAEYLSRHADLLSDYNYYYSRGLRRQYMVKVNVYTWENLKRSENAITPVSRNGEYFKLNVPIDNNCFIIYKGQMFDYELDTNDRKSFKLKGVGLSSLIQFEISKIMIYQMRSTEPGYEIRRYVLKGHNNRHRNTVDFVLPVNQSLILYEGIDHEYEITDSTSIVYDSTKWAPEYVADTSMVTSVNFTRVPLDL